MKSVEREELLKKLDNKVSVNFHNVPDGNEQILEVTKELKERPIGLFVKNEEECHCPWCEFKRMCCHWKQDRSYKRINRQYRKRLKEDAGLRKKALGTQNKIKTVEKPPLTPEQRQEVAKSYVPMYVKAAQEAAKVAERSSVADYSTFVGYTTKIFVNNELRNDIQSVNWVMAGESFFDSSSEDKIAGRMEVLRFAELGMLQIPADSTIVMVSSTELGTCVLTRELTGVKLLALTDGSSIDDIVVGYTIEFTAREVKESYTLLGIKAEEEENNK